MRAGAKVAHLASTHPGTSMMLLQEIFLPRADFMLDGIRCENPARIAGFAASG
jgi:hypothetical protein